jgi:hypothetical protein
MPMMPMRSGLEIQTTEEKKNSGYALYLISPTGIKQSQIKHTNTTTWKSIGI